MCPTKIKYINKCLISVDCFSAIFLIKVFELWDVATKTANHLKPPETIRNHLKPSATTHPKLSTANEPIHNQLEPHEPVQNTSYSCKNKQILSKLL